MFTKPEEHPQIELIVKIININKGEDNKVVKGCRTLQEYAEFIAVIRRYNKTMKLKEAVEKAVDDCIKGGILREFLLKNRARIIKMSIYEYNAKKQREFDREEGRAEERANTEKERKRAEEAEKRADEQQRRADEAEIRAKELEARVAELEEVQKSKGRD